MTLDGKHILVGVCGGIAAYKTASLVRLLVKNGAEVKVVMTPSAKEFITPLTLATLSGNAVISDFFTANTGEWHSHVALGLWADLMVVAPATAASLGKMANGIADNMLVTTYLSMKAPVMLAPSMDLDMYAHPSTRRNLQTLRSYGNIIVEPEAGFLASGLIGKGRMAEPEEIYERIADHFRSSDDLKGKKILITSGPTHEKIDPVRYIGNYSSGKMGSALARECARRGAKVVMVTGPSAVVPRHPSIEVIPVTNARQMYAESMRVFAEPDTNAAILAAAVADYAPESMHPTKIKREKTGAMEIKLVPNPDIAAALGKSRRPGQMLVGFALETDHAEANAADKLRRKGLDWIVLNSMANPKAGFGVDTNQVTILGADGSKREYPAKTKDEVARDIIDLTLGCKTEQ